MGENLFFEFADSLKHMLYRKFNCEVGFQKVTKNNGLESLGLVAVQADGLHPTIPIDTFYWEYMNGEKIESICNTVHKLLKKYSDQGNAPLTDFGKISDRILLKLVNAEKNRVALSHMPHRLFHDLAVTYYLLLEEETDGNATATITNSILSAWNIEEEDLYELALRNTKKKYGSVVQSLEMVLSEILTGSDSSSIICGMLEDDSMDLMYFVSNKQKRFGAAVILYDNVLEEIAGMLQHDFIILPSSVHEVIVVPIMSNVLDKQELVHMVRDINEREVNDDEVLSDNIYLYHIEDKFMEMISCDS